MASNAPNAKRRLRGKHPATRGAVEPAAGLQEDGGVASKKARPEASRGKPPQQRPAAHNPPRAKILKRPATPLQQAVHAGLVPKARRPFALFTASVATGTEQVDFADIVARWTQMSAEQRAAYQERSRLEFQAQATAAAEFGLRRRSRRERDEESGPVETGQCSDGAACGRNVQYGPFVVVQKPDVRALGEGTYGKVVTAVAPEGYRVVLHLYGLGMWGTVVLCVPMFVLCLHSLAFVSVFGQVAAERPCAAVCWSCLHSVS
jgi:hypothetical protein